MSFFLCRNRKKKSCAMFCLLYLDDSASCPTRNEAVQDSRFVVDFACEFVSSKCRENRYVASIYFVST